MFNRADITAAVERGRIVEESAQAPICCDAVMGLQFGISDDDWFHCRTCGHWLRRVDGEWDYDTPQLND